MSDTLIKFLNETKYKLSMRCLFRVSKFILKNIKPYLVKNAIIIFDELYDFPGWLEGV